MQDLIADIKAHLDTVVTPPFRAAGSRIPSLDPALGNCLARMECAVRSVLVVHQHNMYDQHYSRVTDASRAENIQCGTCHVNRWCDTIRGIATHLGITITEDDRRRP